MLWESLLAIGDFVFVFVFVCLPVDQKVADDLDEILWMDEMSH